MRAWNTPVAWILVGFVVVLFAGLVASILLLPPLLVSGHDLRGVDLAKAENDARGTLVAAWTGLSVAFAGVAAFLTYGLSRRGQVTDRFSKAIDQLGADSMAVRTGGLYALEQIVADSPELQWPVMETLFGFLSQRSPGQEREARRNVYPDGATAAELRARVATLSMATDVQAALTIIARRNPAWDRNDATLNLKNLNLNDARLRDARLSKSVALIKVNLRHTHLAGARFDRAHLEGVDFTDAVLIGAHFEGANLSGARFKGADMRLAHLVGATVDTKTDFRYANLKYSTGLSDQQSRTARIQPEILGASLDHLNEMNDSEDER